MWVEQPARAQDVPRRVDRAWHEASTARGPALVIVPMDDWSAPAERAPRSPPPRALHRAAEIDARRVDELAGLLGDARAPALVVGAGADDAGDLGRRWSRSPSASVARSGRSPSARAPASRRTTRCSPGTSRRRASRLRAALAGHDVVLAVGAPVFRQYPYEPGPLVERRHDARPC